MEAVSTPADSIEVVNPATDAPIASVDCTSLTGVDQVCRLAEAASVDWAAMGAFERARMLQDAAIAIRAAATQLAATITQESGKPTLEAQFEIAWAADVFDYYAGVARNLGGRVAPATSPSVTNLILREPLGVIAAIIPWNYPVLLWAWKAAPALAAGNTVVAKPSPLSPLSLPAVDVLLGLPANVHNIVQGGAEVGTALVEHPAIAKVAFTGSSAVGKSILAACAIHAKRSQVEMSGHDAMIVWDDVDLDIAVEAALFATFTNSGQVCTAAERIYVRDRIYTEFTRRLVARVAELVVGDPSEPTTDIGPVVSRAARERLVRYVDQARQMGAKVEIGGNAIEGPGAYFAPTVLTGLSHAAMNNLGEIFGPVVPIVPIASFDEGIERANDNRFGLSAHVLVRDLGLAMKAAHRLKAGTVWINNPLMDNLAAPFGGYREAGLGRELGEEGFLAYTETKHVWIEHELIEQYWWFNARKAMLAGMAE